MPPLLRVTPSLLAATLSLATLCLAAPAGAQAPATGADQAAPPPGDPNAQPGYPPANQYPPPSNGYPPPSNYGQPAYPVQQSPYPPQGGYGAPMPPPAAPPERFGRRGQVVITQGFGFISHSETTTQIRLNPALNFFVANNFSIGFDASLDHTKYDGIDEARMSLSLGLTLGFNIPMGDTLSLWPTLSNSVGFPDSGPNYGTTNLSVPLLIHVAPHFFFAVGPAIFAYRNLTGSGSTTDVHFQQSLETFIGGWW